MIAPAFGFGDPTNGTTQIGGPGKQAAGLLGGKLQSARTAPTGQMLRSIWWAVRDLNPRPLTCHRSNACDSVSFSGIGSQVVANAA